MKLHQLLAFLKKIKANATKKQTRIYKIVQSSTNFEGLIRTYSPVQEEGYVYPSESKNVNYKVDNLIGEFVAATVEMMDHCLAQDEANTRASAMLKIDDLEIGVLPVTSLLFLEAQLNNVKTFINHLPVLAVDKDWSYSTSKGCYESEPKLTAKTKKIVKPVVFAAATKEHPAQVKEVSEDVVEGTWSSQDLSGAITLDQKTEYLNRVDSLINTVLIAREKANLTEVKLPKVGKQILATIFA